MASSESGSESQGSPTDRDQRRPGGFGGTRYLLYVACLAAGLLDVLHVYHKHGHFSWEDWPNFFGFYGLIACVFLVLAAKPLSKLAQRPEDYYDR